MNHKMEIVKDATRKRFRRGSVFEVQKWVLRLQGQC
jgi:hypothetical protein